MTNSPPRWLEWAREIQALSQTGYHFTENEYQRERYERLAEIAAEIVSQHAGLEHSPISSAFKAQIGYATPRVDVRGAVFREGELLLVRERIDGGWTMPGGWADVGDLPSASVEREVFEESGFRVKASKIVGVYDGNRSGPLEIFHAYKIVFLCELIDGAAQPSRETSEVGFFSLEQIPTSFSGERTKARHILDAFATLNDLDRPSIFD